MKSLTKPQFETLMFIRTYYMQHGYMPTHQEIADEFKIDVGGATAHRIQKLVDKEYLIKTKGPRGYMLMED